MNTTHTDTQCGNGLAPATSPDKTLEESAVLDAFAFGIRAMSDADLKEEQAKSERMRNLSRFHREACDIATEEIQRRAKIRRGKEVA